jgi:hypothetical protein
MQSFTSQLAATRANLERIERLFAAHPDLFEHASLAQVCPENARIYIHASGDPHRDWKMAAAMYPKAGWKKVHSACMNYVGFDYDGVIDGVEVSILGAEPFQEPQPLFAGEAAA